MIDFVVSATQVSTYELCPRKWAWRYVDGVESPPNKYAILGVDTHGHLEKWLRQKIVPTGRSKGVQLAQALIPHLPAPQYIDPQHVEFEQYYELCGVKFILVADLWMPKWYEGIPWVYDHKTGGNEEFWLTPEQLPQDIQGSLYGGWALHLTQAERVSLQWNYVRTKGSIITKPVQCYVRGKDIQERLGKTLESARQMKVIAESGVGAMEVPYEARGCRAYGGCPHVQRCGITSADMLSAVIRQGKAAKGDETTMGTEDFLASLAGGAQPAAAPSNGGGQPPLFGPVNPPQTAAAPQQAPLPMAPQQAPLVPQAAPQQAPPQAAPQAPLAPQAAPQQAPPAQPAPAQAPLVPPQAPVTGASAAPAGEKRGRPRKDSPDPWVEFAKVALQQLIAMQAPPVQAANGAAQYADHMLVELQRRRA